MGEKGRKGLTTGPTKIRRLYKATTARPAVAQKGTSVRNCGEGFQMAKAILIYQEI